MKNTLAGMWDVVVIGGGPAGMMAAGTAAASGARVVLVEKNNTLGKKLLITGGGRCNVTNAERDIRKFLKKFKESDKFLFSAFSQWSVVETLDFFHSRNMPTKTEAELRVFPKSDSAQSVWNVLVDYLKSGAVTIFSNTPIKRLQAGGGLVNTLVLGGEKEIHAHSVVLATGGLSRPETGSTGDGFAWLQELGHRVTDAESALVPIVTKEAWVRQLAGVSFPAVKITLYQNDTKQIIRKGKILFTHFGLSGPAILNMSHDIGELLKYGDVFISLDLFPDADYGMLDTRLRELFKTHSNKKFKNCFKEMVPGAMIPIVSKMCAIDSETFAHSITREQRTALVHGLKDIRIQAKGLLGADKAIITSGGVSLTEIDFKTMRSRFCSNLYVIGDMLDIDRPSGGYSLQLCWTTGYIAGKSAAEDAAAKKNTVNKD